MTNEQSFEWFCHRCGTSRNMNKKFVNEVLKYDMKLKLKIRKEIIEEIEKIMNIIKKNRFQSFTKRWMILEDELKHLKENN